VILQDKALKHQTNALSAFQRTWDDLNHVIRGLNYTQAQSRDMIEIFEERNHGVNLICTRSWSHISGRECNEIKFLDTYDKLADDWNLNQDQHHTLSLIQGPLGTGKT